MPLTKKQKVEAKSNDEVLSSRAVDGYFGKDNSVTESNAGPAPRIVLAANYGQIAEASDDTHDTQRSEQPPTKYAEELKGCAGRYVGKVVIVTGGSKGIGEGCVRAFHAAGANVSFCSRGQKDGDSLRDELNANSVDGNEAYFKRCDVSKVDQIEALINATVGKYGKLDCLINNAGWHPPPRTIDEFSIEELQDLFQLNFVSYFAACKFALPHLRKEKGNVINMSSWTGVHGQAQAPTYTATKGAITSFSKGLAIDEAKGGVRVNIVSPGNIWTPLWEAWSDGEPDPHAAKEAGDRVQPLDGGRKGTIIETGRLCLAIAADMTFTTGVDHIQSGGAELGYGVKA